MEALHSEFNINFHTIFFLGPHYHASSQTKVVLVERERERCAVLVVHLVYINNVQQFLIM